MKKYKSSLEKVFLVFILWYSFQYLETDKHIILSIFYFISILSLVLINIFFEEQKKINYLYLIVWGILFYFHFYELLKSNTLDLLDKISLVLLNIFFLLSTIRGLIYKLTNKRG